MLTSISECCNHEGKSATITRYSLFQIQVQSQTVVFISEDRADGMGAFLMISCISCLRKTDESCASCQEAADDRSRKKIAQKS